MLGRIANREQVERRKLHVAGREQGTGNKEQGTGNKEQGTGNREQGAGNKEEGTGNREQGTGNKEEGTGNKEQGTGNREEGTGNKEQGTGNKEQGAGNKEQGTGNREQGAGNKEQGTGNKEQGAGNKEQGTGKQGRRNREQGTRNKEQGTGRRTGLRRSQRGAEERGAPPAASSSLVADLEEVRVLAQRTLDRIRTQSRMLHPVILDDFGLQQAVAWYIGEFTRQHGVHAVFEPEGDLRPAVRNHGPPLSHRPGGADQRGTARPRHGRDGAAGGGEGRR